MSRITTCPHCSTRLRVSEQITDKTLICPHCLQDMDHAWPGSQIRAADINTDVRRDLSKVSIVLAALVGICVVGIAIGFFVIDNAGGPPNFALLMFSFAALDVVVSIAIVRCLVRWGASGDRALSVASVFGILLLSLFAIVAVVVFFFFVCGVMVVSKI